MIRPRQMLIASIAAPALSLSFMAGAATNTSLSQHEPDRLVDSSEGVMLDAELSGLVFWWIVPMGGFSK